MMRALSDMMCEYRYLFFFFQAEDGIRDVAVTGVQTCALPISLSTGLPRVVVHSLRLHEPSRTLRAGTHGRGAWDINLNNFSFMGPHISSLSPASISAGAASLTLTVNGRDRKSTRLNSSHGYIS